MNSYILVHELKNVLLNEKLNSKDYISLFHLYENLEKTNLYTIIRSDNSEYRK